MSELSIKKIISKFYGINLHLLYKAMSKLGLSFNKLYFKNNQLNLNLIDYNKIILFIEVSFLLYSLLKDIKVCIIYIIYLYMVNVQKQLQEQKKKKEKINLFYFLKC